MQFNCNFLSPKCPVTPHFCTSIAFFGIYKKFRAFSENNEPDNLSISEIIDSERQSHLNG